MTRLGSRLRPPSSDVATESWVDPEHTRRLPDSPRIWQGATTSLHWLDSIVSGETAIDRSTGLGPSVSPRWRKRSQQPEQSVAPVARSA